MNDPKVEEKKKTIIVPKGDMTINPSVVKSINKPSEI